MEVGRDPAWVSMLDPDHRLEFERLHQWLRLTFVASPFLAVTAHGWAALPQALIIAAGVLATYGLVALLLAVAPKVLLRYQLLLRFLDCLVAALVLGNYHRFMGDAYYDSVYVLFVVAAAATHGRRGLIATTVVATAAVALGRVYLVAILGVVPSEVRHVTDTLYYGLFFLAVGSAVAFVMRRSGEVVERRESAWREVLADRNVALEQTTEKLEAALGQAHKMEAVGRMAGGIAHDYKNILAAISGYAQLLEKRLTDPRHVGRVQQIQAAAAKGNEMSRQLLAFSRRQDLNPQVVVLNEVVRDAETMLRQLVSHDVSLRFELAEEAGRVRVDPVQLQQVLMNLVTNARDASLPSAPVTISTDAEGVLRVADRGHGMDDETRRQIFEPFFTTKGNGRGTGLGLSTAYGIVAQSGGRIEVESAPGEGATFTITLPRAPD